MNIDFKISGVEEVKAFIKALPRGVKIVAMRAFVTYIIGDKSHGLSHEPARVEHTAENPYQWESDKQRRAYFATNGFGKGIPYTRTHDLSTSWVFEEKNSDWSRVDLQNYQPYSGYVMGDEMQKGHKADGWRNITKVISDNINGAMQAAQRAVNQWINKNG